MLETGASRLDTAQLNTTNHSDLCLKAFHCSSAVSDSYSIDLCSNGDHQLETYIKFYQNNQINLKLLKKQNFSFNVDSISMKLSCFRYIISVI